ncbi:MAG: family 78 glycoside hydrolase catalytic domain [Lachnospiraceae bacterium]
MIIIKQRVNHLENPFGIGTARPEFSWALKADEQGVFQTSYRLVVKNGEQILWDSGEVSSAETSGIRYAGEDLTSATTYTWEISVTAKAADGRTLRAENAGNTFTTGILDPALWKAKWIETERETDPDAVKPVRYLRRTFLIKKKVRRALLFDTAHGIYAAAINGRDVTEDLFAPGFTSYYTRLQYQMTDITDLLQDGTNVWSVEVADGWWRGTTGGDIRNNFGTKTAYFGQILLNYADGTSEWVITDRNFKIASGGLLSSDMKMGDIFDAGKEPVGWQEADFDDAAWEKVPEAEGPHYGTKMLIARESQPVRRHEALTGRLFTDASGDRVIDFGQNIAGQVSLTFRGLSRGQNVTLEFGEDFKDGSFFSENVSHDTPIPGLKRFQQIDYISAGAPVEHYTQRFSVFGFQYLRIRGDAGTLQAGDVTAFAVYTDFPQTGSFHCSNELVNRLVQNSFWSQKGNYLDVPTDCPTRERSPWTGDAQIYAKTAGWFGDVLPFYKKWLQDVAAEQCENGKILNIAPNCMMPHDAEQIKKSRQQMEALAAQAKEHPELVQDPQAAIMANIYADDGAYVIDGSCGWGDVAVIAPWVMYERYGDVSLLRNQYDCAKRWVDYEMANAKVHNTHRNDAPWYAPEAGDDGDYVWDTRYQWGEWLEPDVPNAVNAGPDAFYRPDPEVPTAYMAYSSRLLARMAGILQKEEDAKRYSAFSARVTSVYNRYFVSDCGVIKKGRQAPHVRALAFHLVEGETRAAVASYLNTLLVDNGYHLNTGFLSTPALLNVLSDTGYTDTAYRVLLQEDFPGWLLNVKLGATTIPESWDAKLRHKDSMNHYAYGAVCDFLFSTCCGIRWEEAHPGFRRFAITPRPGRALSSASAVYDSENGRIESSWRRQGSNIHYRFVIPCNTMADVTLQGGTKVTLSSGVYELEEAEPEKDDACS